MKQILLSYESGYNFSADVLKYFNYNFNTYLIYTLYEQDEKGYIKLYMVKILEEFNEKVSQTIRRMSEWDKMKYIIKKLIDEIRNNNIKSFTLLDETELNGLTIYESRTFKLSSDLVEILSRDIENKSLIDETLSEDDIEELEILDLDDHTDNDENEESSGSDDDVEVLEL